MRLVVLFICSILFNQIAHGAYLSIKFHEESNVHLERGQFRIRSIIEPKSIVSSSAQAEIASINNLIRQVPVPSDSTIPAVRQSLQGFDAEELEQWKQTAEEYWKEELEDLSTFYAVNIDKKSVLADAFMALENTSIIESIEFVTDPVPSQSSTPTPNLEGNQNYLNNDGNGIYARQAWGMAGGRGLNVNVLSIEGAWVTTHEDFPNLVYNSGNYSSRDDWPPHGTATLGIVGAKNNGFGITGVASDANFFVQANTLVSLDTIITQSAMRVGSGGIIFMAFENGQFDYMPTCSCNTLVCGNITPLYFTSVFNAVKQATGNGVTVIVSAGNGSVDLDHPSFNGKFDRNIQDSGAIYVAASLSNIRGPACYTNYGSRIDVNGWGDSVATLGYGTAFSEPGTDDRDYTLNFSGTSSAGPIVAGAAASIQGILKARGDDPLSPRALRRVLSASGTPQAEELDRNIGSLPNIIDAIKMIDRIEMTKSLPSIYFLLEDETPPPQP